MPRRDLFAAFSVARTMQHEIESKNKKIHILDQQLKTCESNVQGLKQGAFILLNSLRILLSAVDLKASENEPENLDCNQLFQMNDDTKEESYLNKKVRK